MLYFMNDVKELKEMKRFDWCIVKLVTLRDALNRWSFKMKCSAYKLFIVFLNKYQYKWNVYNFICGLIYKLTTISGISKIVYLH